MGKKRKKVDVSTYSGRIADRLVTLRVATGLTPEEFAEEVTKRGYSLKGNTYRQWEMARAHPNLAAFPVLADVLQVKPRTILPAS